MRDEVREARTNVLLQVVLFLPALLIFGFTAFNVVTTVAFLLLALIRLAFPTPRMRKIEFGLSLVLGLVWLAVTIL